MLNSTTVDDVKKALRQVPGEYSLERMLTLISPAAQQCLEEMAGQAAGLTVQRFGRTIQLYAPLYVSNYCCNSCLYCGYNTATKFKRTRLTIDQAIAEAHIVSKGRKIAVGDVDITDETGQLVAKSRATYMVIP